MTRRLTTILAADIAGFSRLVGADEEGVLAAQRQQRVDLIDPLLAKHGGRIANTAGDSLLVEFPSAVEAVRFAVALQEGMTARNADIADERRIEYRVGINVGDVIADGEDLLGDGVNIAARLEGLARPGGVVLSRAVRDQVRDRIDVELHDLGEVAVKNIQRPVHAFQVLRGHDAPMRVAKARAPRWRIAVLGVAFILALLTIGAWQSGILATGGAAGRQPVLALPDKPSIAVLPLINLSGDDGQAYFVDSFTRSVTTDLSKFEDLFVISSFSAFKYQGTDKLPGEIARELGVRYLLTGDVQPGPEKLRINAQLIDAGNGTAIWAEQYEVPRADIFDVQDDLSGKIAATLVGRIEASARAVERTDLSAYDLVLRASFTAIRKEALLGDIKKLEQAIEIDPNYSRAYAELANRYLLLWRHSLAADPDDALGRARAAAQRGIALNNNSYASHAVLAQIYLYADKDHAQAFASLTKALAINPNDADLMVRMAQLLAFMNRDAKAMELMEKAMRQNPQHPAWYEWNAGFIYAMAGENERAIIEAKTALAVYKTSASIRRILIAAYGQLGQWDEAKRYAAEILERNPDFRLSTHMRNSPYLDPAERAHFWDVFRKAGLPD